MKLQVAFDIQHSDEVLKLVEVNGDLIDIVEIGMKHIGFTEKTEVVGHFQHQHRR